MKSPRIKVPTKRGLYFCRLTGSARWTHIAVVSGEVPYLSIEHVNVDVSGESKPLDLRVAWERDEFGHRLFIYGPRVSLPEAPRGRASKARSRATPGRSRGSRRGART